jgi:hypothetical protein
MSSAVTASTVFFGIEEGTADWPGREKGSKLGFLCRSGAIMILRKQEKARASVLSILLFEPRKLLFVLLDVSRCADFPEIEG